MEVLLPRSRRKKTLRSLGKGQAMGVKTGGKKVSLEKTGLLDKKKKERTGLSKWKGGTSTPTIKRWKGGGNKTI